MSLRASCPSSRHSVCLALVLSFTASYVAPADGVSAPRTEPRFSSLFTAALPVSQHLAVIALFLAVFHQLLVGDLGAGEVGWTCVLLGLVGYFVRKWGWGQVQTTRSDVTLRMYRPLNP